MLLVGLITGIILIIVGTAMDKSERKRRDEEFERRWRNR